MVRGAGALTSEDDDEARHTGRRSHAAYEQGAVARGGLSVSDSTPAANAQFHAIYIRFISDGHAQLPCGATLSWPDDDDIAIGMQLHDETVQRTCILELPANTDRSHALGEAHAAGLIVRGVRYRESTVPTSVRAVIGMEEAFTDVASSLRRRPAARPPYAKRKTVCP